MKAAQINTYGGQEVVVINNDAPKPAVGSDQVLVEVHSAAINPFDIMVRGGFARQMKELTFPATLGGDLAGVVAEVGSDIKDFTVGQEVFGRAGALSGKGSFAEYAPVISGDIAPKPSKISFDIAAALPLAGASALMALGEHINLQAGQKILIHGGAGGIGAFAVQIAKNIGAYVATTVSGQDIEFAKSLGADEVIDYQSQDFTSLIRDYNAVFDTTASSETAAKSYQVLKKGGVFVSMIAKPDEALQQQYGVTAISQFTRVTSDHLKKLGELVETGVIKVNIDKIFPLDQTAEAMEYLKTAHTRGKVVIKVKD